MEKLGYELNPVKTEKDFNSRKYYPLRSSSCMLSPEPEIRSSVVDSEYDDQDINDIGFRPIMSPK